MEYDDEDAGTLDNMGQLRYAQAAKAQADGDAGQAAQLRKEAYDYLRKAIEIKPEQIATNYILAKMYYEDGELEKARKCIDEALRVPGSGIIQYSQAQMEALKAQIG